MAVLDEDDVDVDVVCLLVCPTHSSRDEAAAVPDRILAHPNAAEVGAGLEYGADVVDGVLVDEAAVRAVDVLRFGPGAEQVQILQFWELGKVS
ncbi:hypothetical protein D9615_008312 [Tricholomella constricta]|uniref:Uncharacterized protein n=1 Tax=Tricholomella constricta TaxID=117010 RepID=A0A8H5HDL4_9AGAR|nr:hypothetical protein D9615_008312 [Tricholomella constricta]